MGMHSKDMGWRRVVWLSSVISGLVVAYIDLPMPFEKPRIDAGTAFLVVTPLIVLIFSAFLGNALRSRMNERLRARAIAGESSAMALARKQPERLGSALAETTLVIQWRADGKPAGSITANDEGICLRSAGSEEVSLLWSEVRLFELWEASENRRTRTGYCLYGMDGRFVEWSRTLVFAKSRDDRLGDEYRQRLNLLLAQVRARTGLPLRTLSPSLAAPDETALAEIRAFRRVITRITQMITAAFLVLILAVLAGIAVLTLAMPLTRSLALNLYVALAAAAYAIYLLPSVSGAVWVFIHSSPPPPVTLPSVPPAALDSSVSIKVPQDLKNSLSSLLFGVILIGTLYPLRRSYHDFPVAGHEDHMIATLYSDLRFAIFFGFVVGVPVILKAVSSFLGGTRSIVADEKGLHTGRGQSQQYIPWPDLDVLNVDVSSHKPMSFTLIGNGTELQWPANARWVRPPEGAAADDAGAQFAAIVAERAGVQPVTRWNWLG